jgi:hypothetical protein
MNILNEMLFICKFCQESFPYQDFQKHSAQCTSVNYRCPAKGCQQRENLQTLEKLKQHLNKTCKFVNVTCSICKTELMSAEREMHDCIETLQNALGASRLIIQRLTKEKEELDAEN